MANVHSHAFQRDLRGFGERSEPKADFWSWREEMYRLAEALEPDSMREVAGRVYAEMAAAGYGAVGEFHYVHHRPDGSPYEEPNAMAIAAAEAAAAARLRIVLLPAAYHRGGHARFRDPSVDDYLARVDALRLAGHAVGVAAHSVRAVPADWLSEIAAYAGTHGLVRHVHAHEQPRELEECQAEHGCSPIELLHRTGFLGERATVVHGIHVSDRDVALLADSGTIVATCPTTEGNLGDGHFPALRYRDAGVRLAIGSDSNAVVDPFEELRELETGARRDRRRRRDRGRPRPPAAARRVRGGRDARGGDERLGRYRPARAPPDLLRLGLRARDRLLARRRRRRLGARVRHDRLRLREHDHVGRGGRAGGAGAGQRRRRPGRGGLHVRRRRPRPLPAPGRRRLRGVLAGPAAPLRRRAPCGHDAGVRARRPAHAIRDRGHRAAAIRAMIAS
jgi:formimidoylglutamate deiminase